MALPAGEGMGTVIDAIKSSPPGGPSEGDSYIVKPTGSGDWVGKDRDIATYTRGAWQYNTPQTGQRVYDQNTEHEMIFDGTNWIELIDRVFVHFITNTGLAVGSFWSGWSFLGFVGHDLPSTSHEYWITGFGYSIGTPATAGTYNIDILFYDAANSAKTVLKSIAPIESSRVDDSEHGSIITPKAKISNGTNPPRCQIGYENKTGNPAAIGTEAQSMWVTGWVIKKI